MKLFKILAFFLYLHLASFDQNCCNKKTVSGYGGMDGDYILKREGIVDGFGCSDGCIYKRYEIWNSYKDNQIIINFSTDDVNPENEYCFKRVQENAATIKDECDATIEPPPEAPFKICPFEDVDVEVFDEQNITEYIFDVLPCKKDLGQKKVNFEQNKFESLFDDNLSENLIM